MIIPYPNKIPYNYFTLERMIKKPEHFEYILCINCNKKTSECSCDSIPNLFDRICTINTFDIKEQILNILNSEWLTIKKYKSTISFLFYHYFQQKCL